jgi:hypothetical protein
MNEAVARSESLPDPAAVVSGTDWGTLGHAYGSAEDTPKNLAALLDADQKVRSKALQHLHHAVHHQNTLYTATIPTALYVAAVLADPRIDSPVDKERHSFPGPMRAELLGWLGSVAEAAGDEAAAVSRRLGFPPEDYLPFVQTCRIRPSLYNAVTPFLDDPDPHVREAAIAACIPLLDDPRLLTNRAKLVPLLRDPLGVSELWQYRERAIEALDAWGEDAEGLEGQRNAFMVCDSQSDAESSTARLSVQWGDQSDLPF